MKNLSLLILLSLFFGGCATQLKYEMNNVKFLTPETKGKFLKGDIGLGAQQTHKVVVTEVFDSLIFNSTSVVNSNTIENGSDVSLMLNLGLLERLDVFLFGGKTGLKFQFLGTPFLNKSNGYSAALAVASGKDEPESGTEIYSNNSTTRSYKTSVEVDSWEFSLLFGRRTTENHLYYANLFYDKYNYEGSLTSTQFSTINAKGKSKNFGLLLGYELSNTSIPNLSWKIETGIVQGQLESYAKKTSGVYGTSLSIGW